VSLYPAAPISTLSAIPAGTAGTKATLGLMVKLVRQWRKDPGIWKLSREITRNVPARDFRGQVDRMFHWVKQHIRYVNDVRGVETLATPKATLEVAAGDCDDMSVLLASLLESIGHPTRFVALGFNGDEFSHVLTETRLGSNSQWLALDPTVPTSTVGWKPRDATRALVFHV